MRSKVLLSAIVACLFLALPAHAQVGTGKQDSAVSTKENRKATKTLVSEINKSKDVKWDRIKKAILAGADVNARNKDGWTALMYVASMNEFEIAKLLLEKGAEVNATDSSGWTALMCAALFNQTATVELLLEKGADVNARTVKYKCNSLIWAVASGHLETAKLLLDHGADANIRDTDGKSVLAYARSEEMKQLLRSYGAKE